jgi:hypothetical protein
METMKKRECERLGRAWSDPEGPAPKRVCPRCGKPVSAKARHVGRTVLTGMGEVTYRRHHYWCGDCRQGFFPKDEELGFDEEALSGDVVLFALDLLMGDTFRATSTRMERHHGLSLSATRIQHLFERTSAPLADAEKPRPPIPLPLEKTNRHRPAMIQVDGSMIRHVNGWHEAKLLSVETLGDAHRVYLADTQDKDRLEAQVRESRGFSELTKRDVLWIADGAEWIWRMKDRLCPQAHELLDFYHAAEHGHAAARALFGEGDACTELFAQRIRHLLLTSDIETLFDELKECIPYKPKTTQAEKEAEALWPLLSYYENNRNRLGYREFRQRGWPIGSGAIESAHKRVIQKRMKMSGMKWSPQNAQRMATMQCLYASNDGQNFERAIMQAAA